MSLHLREVCEHGKVIRQCRCPEPTTEKVITPCPFQGEPGHETAGQEPDAVSVMTGDADRRLTEELGHYLAAVNRYARDATFHARVKRVQNLMRIAEPSMVKEADTGALWGIVTSLHLVDIGIESQHPIPKSPNATVYGCPLRECGWALEVPEPIDWAEQSGIALNPRVLLRLHNATVERDLKAHLVDEHAETIGLLADLLPKEPV